MSPNPQSPSIFSRSPRLRPGGSLSPTMSSKKILVKMLSDFSISMASSRPPLFINEDLVLYGGVPPVGKIEEAIEKARGK